MNFEATITSKGQVTLPARLRAMMNLKDGDKVEFYSDHEGRITMRARNRSTSGFLDALEPRRPDPNVGSDDEAIELAVAARDNRTKRLGTKAE